MSVKKKLAKQSKPKYGKWVNTKRNFGEMLYLTEADDPIDTEPKHLLTSLLPHQKTTVKAMVDLETKRFIRLESLPVRENNYSSVTRACSYIQGPVIETTAGVLSEKLGSGKSFEVLALISLNPIPRGVAEISSLPFPHPSSAGYIRNALDYYPECGFGVEVRKTYKTLFRQSVIFVGKSVLGQWRQYITEFTNFKVLVIENVRHLRDLHKMVFAPTDKLNHKFLRRFDIILVKNKTISGKFDVPELEGTPLASQKVKPILTVFGELFRDISFARVVLDDFDTINIPNTARVVPALFTWFISATTKSAPPRRTMVGKTYYDIRNVLLYHRPAYTESWQNHDLFTHFNVCNVDEFIDKSTNVGKVHFYSYKFVNPDESYIELLGAMGAQDATNIMEMLNGDAVNTAAEAAGVKTTSVADIFEKMLGGKWIKYKKFLEISQYIPDVRGVVDELLPLPPDEKSITQTALTRLSKNIHSAGPLAKVEDIVVFWQNAVIEHIDILERDNNTQKEETGKAIERVKSNLSEGECPICCEELGEGIDDKGNPTGTMIMKCCGVAFCTHCVTAAAKLRNNGQDVAGICPNCRRQISFTHMLLIDQDIDLNRIIQEKITDEDEEPEPVVEDVEPKIDSDVESEELTKFSCIVGIIMGNKYEDLRKVQNIEIDHILKGTEDLPEPDEDERKVLVFANFNETLTNLQKELDTRGVAFERLQGTPKQIDRIVARYWLPNDHPQATNVLLINGAEYCAGLNLQNTTDLIFTHKVIDRNVESQIVGRAVRVGRTKNLNVHYVLYHNEFGHLPTA